MVPSPVFTIVGCTYASPQGEVAPMDRQGKQAHVIDWALHRLSLSRGISFEGTHGENWKVRDVFEQWRNGSGRETRNVIHGWTQPAEGVETLCGRETKGPSIACRRQCSS